MPLCFLPDLRLNYRDEGDPRGPVVVFSHGLGVDLSIWDAVIERLPAGLRLIRYDHRGHGGSDVPAPPYSMGALIRDAEALLDHLAVKDCVFVGLSLGGLVAQGLAVKRLDLVRAMVLSNTAAKIGIASQWQERIALLNAQGMEGLAEATMQRWFSRRFREAGEDAPWRDLLMRCDVQGYAGCAAAIAGTDFYTSTAGLTLPTLAIAAADDGATPPDLVRETAELVRGSQFRLIRQAGHLPCVERPEAYAALLTEFMASIGHLP